MAKKGSKKPTISLNLSAVVIQRIPSKTTPAEEGFMPEDFDKLNLLEALNNRITSH